MTVDGKLPAPIIPRVSGHAVSLGGDPEFFFKDKGVIIGSEKVLPAVGVAGGYAGNKIIIDGVQGEFNIAIAHCREGLATHMANNFVTLKDVMLKVGKDISADFSRTVEISPEKLDELSDSSKRFGCAPSLSIYKTKPKINVDTVDPLQYRIRAAGGHIHFGHSHGGATEALTNDAKRTVAMLDLICGNTSVLVDRDPGNIERRKMYGRAGEYRLPAHGLEYRTLSNYWLHSSPLFSLAMGLGRQSVYYMSDKTNKERFYSEFMGKVKPKKVRDAINNNDFDLAMENFDNIKQLFIDSTKQMNIHIASGYSGMGGAVPIDMDTIDDFLFFVNEVKSHGLEKFWPHNPMNHWTTQVREGFYNFASRTIRPLRLADEKRKAMAPAAIQAAVTMMLDTPPSF